MTTVSAIDEASRRLLDCYVAEGERLLRDGFEAPVVEALLLGAGGFARSPFGDVGTASPAPPQPPPLEVVDQGAGELRQLLRRADVPVLRDGSHRGAVELPHDGVLVATNGRTAAELAVELGTDDVVVVDRLVEPDIGSAIAVTAHPRCRRAVLDCAVGLLQAARLTTFVVPDRPGLVTARVVAVLVNEAARLGMTKPMEFECTAGGLLADVLVGSDGPLAWSGSWGIGSVAEILDSLETWYGPGEYLQAPALRRAALLERS
jgi:hypothetical protein